MSEWSAARTQQHTEMTELPWVQRSRRRSHGADAAESLNLGLVVIVVAHGVLARGDLLARILRSLLLAIIKARVCYDSMV